MSKKQGSVYFEEEDEKNIDIIKKETSLKKTNDVICYSLKVTAESFKGKGYINEKALADFVALMLANGMELDMIKDIALKNLDKLITQALEKY